MVRRWVHRKRMEGERAEVVERGLPSCDLETAAVAMSKINAIFWNPFKKQNSAFWHSFARQSSDMAHRSTDYTAQNSSRASTSCQKKHHPDHPGTAPPTNNDIPRSGYLSGFDKFATNYGLESWSCRLMFYRWTYTRPEIYPRILSGTTMPNAYNEVAKYCETKARLTFVSLEMTFLSRHYNVAKRHATFSERKSRLTSVYFSEYEFSSFYCGAIFFTYCIQRSNTFTADLRVSVTGAALRDNSIKVMPDMAKGER
ncbi:hypothetical protein ALC56_06734 [Trachymyrmex septentrionalis]|uniref:Uncharacterized protein n=1 Tax=Trachymyrmex septentrionalis TaxID=34720 RepID=A0A195FDJ8_9HYME|nr:hypothetical protein ALC56_06734 [Trachymyrmex septentrionalis]